MDTIFETGRGGSFEGAQYDYQFANHVDNFKMLGTHIVEFQGLGPDQYGRDLLGHIMEMFGRSLKIIIPALILSFILGIAKGVIDYRVRRSKGKTFGQFTTWGILSVPDLALIIGIQLAILTMISNGWLFRIDLFGHDTIDNVLMNILFLSIYPTAYIANTTFQALQTEQGMDYIRTAKSKGTPQFVILYKHMLKNGMARIFSHTNTMVLYILSNLFIIEIFTEYRGAAFYFYNSLGNPSQFYVDGLFSARTIEVIGYIFFFTVLILAANLVTAAARSVMVPAKGGDPS
ncbi:ABC transporter permease subunit [Planococcus sp. X10-3]|uniref:ABC transporter permease subunit n=1 Tax=Planococcus sp. X10-3 TaxID=3061240 RepID=UPI003BB016B2